MKINIKATNVELTKDINDYLNKKIASFEKLIDPADESVICDAEVGKSTEHHRSGEVYFASLNIHIAGKYLNAVSEQENIYAAIDEVKDEMTTSLRRHKNKKEALFRRGAAKIKEVLKGLKW